jgi:hypothetical protein
LIRQAAQAEVLYSDDTGIKVLNVQRTARDKRTGLHTTGVMAAPRTGEDGPRIALYVTGLEHAGENIRDLLQCRKPHLDPALLMCDALAANTFVDVADSFPAECRHILDEFAKVYGFDEDARQQGLDPQQRLRYHREHSEPIMKGLREWLSDQLQEKRTEPNSRLGGAMKYILNHWNELTLFLRHAGAPLDNNICQSAIKKAVLHRKNALFYRTLNGAEVGDLFMSAIHTCELNGVNPFEYLNAVQRNAIRLREDPSAWMPWNFRATLARAPS